MYEPRPQRKYPPAWRVVLAFALAPGIAALLMATLMPAYEGLADPAERILRTAQIYSLFGAYPTAAFVGIPAFLMMRRHFAATAINCMMAGAFVAALPWILLVLLPPSATSASIGGRATVVHGKRTMWGWLSGAEVALQIAAFGAVAGLIFWAVAAAGRHAGEAGEVEG